MIDHVARAQGCLLGQLAGDALGSLVEFQSPDQDAALTHPNLICQQANALFAMGIAHAIQSGCDRKELYLSLIHI